LEAVSVALREAKERVVAVWKASMLVLSWDSLLVALVTLVVTLLRAAVDSCLEMFFTEDSNSATR
jgi:hypothetical protein